MPTEDIEKLWCHSYSHLPSRVVDSALSKAFPDFIGGVGFDASFPPYQDTVWYERRCCRYLSEVLRISERIAIEEESIRDAEQKLAELCKLRPGAEVEADSRFLGDWISNSLRHPEGRMK